MEFNLVNQNPLVDNPSVVVTEIISLEDFTTNGTVTSRPNFNAVTFDLCLNCTVTPVRLTWRDILDPSFYELVPEHWLQFEPPSHQEHVALGILYIIILIPALVGNFMIIWLYFTSKPLRTPSNILVVNLAISDLFMNIKMPIFIYNSFCYGPVTGAWGCKFYGFLGGFSGTCAIMTIAAMSAERYISISRPLNPSGRMTTTRAILVALFIWIYSLIFSVMPLLGINRYIPEGYLTSCSFDYLSTDMTSRVFVLAFFAAAFCVPLLIICYSYCGIVMAVRSSERGFKGNSQTHRPVKGGKAKSNGTGTTKTEVRLAQIAFTLISIWLISWTPYATVALMGIFTDRKALTPMTSMIPALFAKTSSVFNPFVYSLTHPRFKMEINRRYFWWKSAHNSFRHRLSMHSSISGSFAGGQPEDDENIGDQQEIKMKEGSKTNLSKNSKKNKESLDLSPRDRDEEDQEDIFDSSSRDSEDDGESTEEEIPLPPPMAQKQNSKPEVKTAPLPKGKQNNYDIKIEKDNSVYTISQAAAEGYESNTPNKSKIKSKTYFRRSL